MEDTTFNICQNMPALPKDDEGPIFAEPWQAHAFALAVKLCDDGHFKWQEWVDVFSKEVKNAQAAGDPDLGNTYYNHWLNCLEHMITERHIIQNRDIVTRKEAWRQAYLNTPHGQPVELKSE